MVKWRAKKNDEVAEFRKSGKLVQSIGPFMILDWGIETPYKLTVEDLNKKIDEYRNGKPRQHGILF